MSAEPNEAADRIDAPADRARPVVHWEISADPEGNAITLVQQ